MHLKIVSFKDDSYNWVGLFKWSITRGGVFKVGSANDEEENLIKASHQIKNKKMIYGSKFHE